MELDLLGHVEGEWWLGRLCKFVKVKPCNIRVGGGGRRGGENNGGIRTSLAICYHWLFLNSIHPLHYHSLELVLFFLKQ